MFISRNVQSSDLHEDVDFFIYSLNEFHVHLQIKHEQHWV